MDADVVFEGVRASDVVVVRVPGTPDQAARLVLLARHRFELHLYKAVFNLRIILEADRVSGFAGLFEHIRFAWGRVLSHHRPFGFTLAGLSGGPARRRLARFSIVEID